MKEILLRVLILVIAVAFVAAVLFVVGMSATASATFEYTEDEVDLLAGLIAAEARGERYDGKLAVGTVVMNRLDSERLGVSIQSVIYSKNQFAKPKREYSEECLLAAIEVLDGFRSFPDTVLFFKTSKQARWRNAVWHCTIGNHNFYREE